jgi:poly(3-hydroxybutyrate) depolymerase
VKKLPLLVLSTVLTVTVPLSTPVWAQVPEGDPTDLPVLSSETPRGRGEAVDVSGQAPVAKTADGEISDWIGSPSRFGGTAIYSGGELIYQDHLFDALGPDDGRDAARFDQTDPLEEALPGTYRIDALAQADAPGEFGAPAPERFSYDDTYGDANPRPDSLDIEELRLAVSGDDLAVLARTTTMTGPNDIGLLLLADTEPGTTSYEVPFNSGITTSTGDVAVFVSNGNVRLADLAAGTVTALNGAAASASPGGWTNALEATLRLADVSAADGSLSLAAASGKPNDDGTGFAHLTIETAADAEPHANLANVAFRLEEPVRTWFDKQQALSLHAGTIDPFFLEVDADRLLGGTSQEWVPGPGYHDRIFISDPATGVPIERGRDGIFQHYGVYLPESYDGTETPLQWWLHWRGGNAHTGASIVPKVFKQFGEDKDTIVVAPSGRGMSTWYVGRGHVDFRQVWSDVLGSFAIDRDRVYVTGHSMGGWGSYLLTLLYPDRFAAAAPVAGPVTQGAWTGLEFEGCNEEPCYVSANDGRPVDQHSRKLLENALHVPYAILHGTSDELVPYSGVFRQAERLVQLGYRHRLYTYPGYEHYSHPLADQWAEAASYLQSFSRPENPAHVVYKRDMLFEIATEEVQSGGATLDFDFDSAYWMSELTPVDSSEDVASFDGRSLAIPETPHIAVPDTGAPTAPGQTGPYVITGLQWLDDPGGPAEVANAFDVDVSGASAVRLELGRMRIDSGESIAGTVDTSDPLELRLAGDWTTAPEVLLDGHPASTRFEGNVLTVSIPSGTHDLTITPTTEPQETVTNVEFTDDSDTSAQYSDTATLQARLTGAEGAPLADETLSFTLGSSSASATTGAGGIATARIPVSEAPGETSAGVAFAGRSGELTPSVASADFTVEREDSATDLVVTGKGSKRRLTATLSDADSGSPVSGAPIRFTADGTAIGMKETDASGVATISVPPGYRGGGIAFTATFEGDAFFLGSSDTEAVS